MTARALKVVDRGADGAAADAAQEARAEALEQARKPAGSKKPAPADGWHRFVVDVWITNFNFTEFGIYKRSRNKAKSRQFTSDMDIFAEIIENGERTGLIGYREDLWEKAQGTDKRLVFKLFNETVNWRATMDLMIGRSLQQTIGARGLPVMTYSINTDEDEHIIYLERSANKWPFLPENFSFFLIDAKGKPHHYRLKRDFITLAGDYTLFDHRGRRIGFLDGKVFSIGGKWKGQVKAEHASRQLLTVLKLFGGMMTFNGDCRRHMRRLWKDVMAGKVEPDLERQEADLYRNPRRVR